MIRVDLAKNELERAELPKARTKPVTALLNGITSRIPESLKSRAVKVQVDIFNFLFFGLTVSLACLPQLFFMQYETYVITQHQVRTKALNQALTTVTQEVTSYSAYGIELQSYEAQKKLVTDRISIIRELLSARGTPINVLDALGQNLPRRAWLNDITLTLTGEKPIVSVNGQAFKNEEVSDYIDKLNESVFVSDVNLEEVTKRADTKEKSEFKGFRFSAKPKMTLPLALVGPSEGTGTNPSAPTSEAIKLNSGTTPPKGDL